MLRRTACGDVQRAAAEPLRAWNGALCHPAGRWMGTGLAGPSDGHGMAAGSLVSEEAMARGFRHMPRPVTDVPLGRSYPIFKPLAERIATRIAPLPCG